MPDAGAPIRHEMSAWTTRSRMYLEMLAAAGSARLRGGTGYLGTYPGIFCSLGFHWGWRRDAYLKRTLSLNASQSCPSCPSCLSAPCTVHGFPCPPQSRLDFARSVLRGWSPSTVFMLVCNIIGRLASLFYCFYCLFTKEPTFMPSYFRNPSR